MMIAVGAFRLETNSFSSVRASFNDFDFAEGRDALERLPVAGYFRDHGFEVLPTISANALPSGSLELPTYRRFCDLLLAALDTDRRIDGIWLHLHGAMEVEGLGSGEAALLSEIRKKIGDDIPIALALDFHANNDEALVRMANVICGYRTAPHTDVEDTEIRAARLLLRCVRQGLLPRPVMVKVPLMISGDKVLTNEEPARSLMKAAEHAEASEKILCVSVFNGQPWVDAPNTGASVIVVPASDERIGRLEAARLSSLFWRVRREFRFGVEAMDMESAVDAALNAAQFPVYITDSGDNVTAGAAGDNALLLKMLLEKRVPSVLVAGITDPRFVRANMAADVGVEVGGVLGGKLEPVTSVGVRIRGRLTAKGSMLGWDGEDAGNGVAVEVRGLTVIATERRCAFTSPKVIFSLGLELRGFHTVVVKLGYLFPELSGLPARAILALTPGASCEAVEKLPFRSVRRPVYPLDTDFSWEPESEGSIDSSQWRGEGAG